MLIASANEKTYPKFSLKDQKFDQTQYVGRLMTMFDLIDPRTLFVSDERLQECVAMLKAFEATGSNGQHSDGELWEARKIVDATIHPATGDKMMIVGRMSAFVPVNLPVAAGMMMHGPTSVAATVFWQWMNQSYNVVNNYTNRAGANIDWAPLMTSYGIAVTSAISIALGANALMKKMPALARLGPFVPYLAVITAGTCNVTFTRMEEMRTGISVADEEGNILGNSVAAAKQAVFKTVTTRSMFLPIFPLLIPPITMGILRKSLLKNSPKPLLILAELTVIGVALGVGLPCALAILPQSMTLDVNDLEPDIQEIAKARGLAFVYANKGL